ncbi:MAG: primosomal protein N' (replication factor Y) - superfamily II helicase, partial [Thiothrix sp.]
TFKHVLLPVWSAAFRYNGETYRFVINGRNGKTQGERPYSKVKIALTVLFSIALAASAAYFLEKAGLLQQMMQQGQGYYQHQRYQYPTPRRLPDPYRFPNNGGGYYYR